MLARPAERPLPPICAWNTFLGVVGYFKAEGVPNFVTHEALPVVALELRSRVITSMRALGLISNNGQTQEALRKLVAARGTGQWELNLRALMKAAYPYLTSLDLTQADSTQLRRAFSIHLQRETDNIGKCESFYLNLARTAGTPLSEALQKRVRAAEMMANVKAVQKQESAASNKGNAVRKFVRPVTIAGSTVEAGKRDSMKPGVAEPAEVDRAEQLWNLIDLLDDEGMNDKERAALLTLLAYVKRKTTAPQ